MRSLLSNMVGFEDIINMNGDIIIIKMSTYFIDFQGFIIKEEMIIKELCIMDANDMLNPYHSVFNIDLPWKSLSMSTKFSTKINGEKFHNLSWAEGNEHFCPSCIMKNYNTNDTFYVLENEDYIKTNVLEKYFPGLRFIQYSKTVLKDIPSNISCIWRDHGEICAYKHCLAMCTDYCKTY